ncbi:hypothetical protein M885DRAFT_617021 [Pelagophyceae sp. CCMP2097]|nr:hypothetical protein M885DRAFT_617021 [Pelagophyceae sp. CCMP2097]
MKPDAACDKTVSPSPFELAPPLFLGGIMLAFLICDLGISTRASTGTAAEIGLANEYFGKPIPIKTTLVDIIAPSILLLVPKLVVEDILPLAAGARDAQHWCGAAALVLVLALVAFGGAFAGPSIASAAEKGFDADAAQEVSRDAAPFRHGPRQPETARDRARQPGASIRTETVPRSVLLTLVVLASVMTALFVAQTYCKARRVQEAHGAKALPL